MRRGFLLAVVLLGGLVVWAVIVLAPRSGMTVSAQPDSLASGSEVQSVEAQASTEANFSPPTELPQALRAEEPRVTNASAPVKISRTEEPEIDGRDEQREAQLAARVAEFKILSTKTDSASVAALLSEVKNPDEEIRQAALDAITQSGHRAALPGLREIAAQTEDRQEKQAIEEVIEFLSIPTLTEVLRGQTATNGRLPAR